MTTTPNLLIDHIAASQAQKEVSHRNPEYVFIAFIILL
jgi:hypothetical protein